MDQRSIQGGVKILLVASCYRNRDKLPPDELIGWYVDFTLPYLCLFTYLAGKVLLSSLLPSNFVNNGDD